MNVTTIAISGVVSAAVSFAVSGLLKSSIGWLGAWRIRRKDLHRLRTEGDHLSIGTASLVPLGPGASSRVRVRVAPAWVFKSQASIDPDKVDRWVERLAPILLTCRLYSDPTELIRFSVDDFFAEVKVNGLVEVCVPVADVIHDDRDGAHELDLRSVIASTVPIVVSLVDGSYETMFPERLRSQVLDWHFDVSRVLNNTTYGGEGRVGLVFPGREPGQSTPGQSTPLAGEYGFGWPVLRSVPLGTEPSEIVLRFLRGLIERSGYTGNDEALADLRATTVEEMRRFRARNDDRAD